MTRIFSLSILLVLSSIIACKTTHQVSSNGFMDKIWELEYISGPKIAFEAIFPEKKPFIGFDVVEKKVLGNNGCNGYSTAYKINYRKETITFGEPGPSTLMYCGEGESYFLKAMEKVTHYQLDDEEHLHLLFNNVTLLRFKVKN